jgi:hypothetical protein
MDEWDEEDAFGVSGQVAVAVAAPLVAALVAAEATVVFQPKGKAKGKVKPRTKAEKAALPAGKCKGCHEMIPGITSKNGFCTGTDNDCRSAYEHGKASAKLVGKERELSRLEKADREGHVTKNLCDSVKYACPSQGMRKLRPQFEGLAEFIEEYSVQTGVKEESLFHKKTMKMAETVWKSDAGGGYTDLECAQMWQDALSDTDISLRDNKGRGGSLRLPISVADSVSVWKNKQRSAISKQAVKADADVVAALARDTGEALHSLTDANLRKGINIASQGAGLDTQGSLLSARLGDNQDRHPSVALRLTT